MFNTSVNMSMAMYNQLASSGLRFNVNICFLIRQILNCCSGNLRFYGSESGLTVYQKKIQDDEWKCFRLALDLKQCNDVFLFRFLFRISLSRLIAVGFVLFFDRIVKKLEGKYQNKNLQIKGSQNSYTELIDLLKESVKDSFKLFIFPLKNDT